MSEIPNGPPRKWTHCPLCSASWSDPGNLMLIEYGYPHPEAYDGISEYKCLGCQARFGRWTGKLLADGESEERFGGQ